jgi:hypothetical protein
MKRDWEVIRKILLKIEELPTEDSTFSSHELEGIDNAIVAFQMRLMLDSGLIEGSCRDAIGGAPYCHAFRLTWAGCEFLDAIRRDTVWNEIKKQAKTKTVDLPIGIINSVAKVLIEGLMT